MPGAVVSYTLYLTNTGNISDTFDIDITHTWDVGYAPTTGLLAPGESVVLVITVYAPAGGNRYGCGSDHLARRVHPGARDRLVTSVYHRVYLAIIGK